MSIIVTKTALDFDLQGHLALTTVLYDKFQGRGIHWKNFLFFYAALFALASLERKTGVQSDENDFGRGRWLDFSAEFVLSSFSR